MYLSNTSSNDASEGTLLSVPSGNMTTNYYFAKACQGEARLASYYWSNNKWNELTKKYLYFLENKVLTNISYFGGLYAGSGAVIVNNNGIYFYSGYNEEFTYIFTSINKINFSLYSKIDVTGFTTYKTNFVTVGIPVSQLNTSVTSYSHPSANFRQYSDTKKFETTLSTLTFDISSITGEGYLGFHIQISDSTGITITDVRLY